MLWVPWVILKPEGNENTFGSLTPLTMSAIGVTKSLLLVSSSFFSPPSPSVIVRPGRGGNEARSICGDGALGCSFGVCGGCSLSRESRMSRVFRRF